MRYRPEVDGLRAVAVIPVIFFHAGFSYFSGGFVGVDVFFVISGYLITSIIVKELDSGTFSFLSFYDRRVRRILPALFAVMAASLCAGWLWMLPSQFAELGSSVVASGLFLSNVFFWLTTDYFASASDMKPLLHTWSLSAEEQFYLVFPVIALAIWKLKRDRAPLIMAVLVLAGFGLSEWATDRFLVASFYLLRPWELLAGSTAAFVASRTRLPQSEILSLMGLALILVTIPLYGPQTPFPGAYALPPVLGTVLILLFCGENTRVGKLLSTGPLVGIGLISYSAYLWHQPIFAFARIRSVIEPGTTVMAALVAVTLGVAYLSWLFIEQPFRKPAKRSLRPFLAVTFGAVGTALLVMFGATINLHGGYPERFPSELEGLLETASEQVRRECHFSGTSVPPHPQAQCRHSDAEGQVDVLLLGDSHSLALAHELGGLLRQHDIGFYDVSYSACLPLPGFEKANFDPSDRCSEFVEGALSYARAAGINTIVLAARWPLYLAGFGYDNGEGGADRLSDFAFVPREDDGSSGAVAAGKFIPALDKAILDLSATFRIVLVYPIPEAGWNVPQVAIKRLMYDGIEADVTTSNVKYKARTAEITQTFDRLSVRSEIVASRVDEVLCDEELGRCLNAAQGRAFYRDDNHLSEWGAALVAPIILRAVETSIDQ